VAIENKRPTATNKESAMKHIGSMSVFTSFCALWLASSASASPPLEGYITELWVNDGYNSNIAYVSVGTSFTSSCGATSVYLIIDFSLPAMKEAYAMALAANMAGRSVRMAGVGACYGQNEKLNYIRVTQ
jgi:hypothetical protein